MLTQLFQLSLDCNDVPQAWKENTIIPLPKKVQAKELEDFRSMVLTPVLCKCMERVASQQLSEEITGKLNPLQFAYRVWRGVEDATLTLLNKATKHLDLVDSKF